MVTRWKFFLHNKSWRLAYAVKNEQDKPAEVTDDSFDCRRAVNLTTGSSSYGCCTRGSGRPASGRSRASEAAAGERCETKSSTKSAFASRAREGEFNAVVTINSKLLLKQFIIVIIFNYLTNLNKCLILQIGKLGQNYINFQVKLSTAALNRPSGKRRRRREEAEQGPHWPREAAGITIAEPAESRG